MSQQKDLGLLILRAAGCLLVLTFGIQKIGWYVTALRTGKHLWSIGLAPLIGQIGFPVSISVILAIWVTFNESIGAFLIGCGLFTAHPGGERSVRNGWRILHERATWRRLAQGSTLPDCFYCSDLYRRWQIFLGSSAQAERSNAIGLIAASNVLLEMSKPAPQTVLNNQ